MSPLIISRAVLETLRICAPTIVDSMRGQVKHPVWDQRLRSYGERILKQAKIGLQVEGTENVQPGESYIIMSNHQSLYDIPVLFASMPLSFRMAAKEELFRVPIWGPALQISGFIRIDRKNGLKARKELEARGKLLRENGLSLWIAPEGTRSPDGRLQEFKRGGFYLAKLLKLPILPVSIDGTCLVLGKKEATIHLGKTVKVSIHPPIACENFDKNSNELVARVEQAIGSGLSIFRD